MLPRMYNPRNPDHLLYQSRVQAMLFALQTLDSLMSMLPKLRIVSDRSCKNCADTAGRSILIEPRELFLYRIGPSGDFDHRIAQLFGTHHVAEECPRHHKHLFSQNVVD